MNIVQVPGRFFPQVGGVERHVHELSKQFVDRGHRVTVLCTTPREGGAADELRDDIQIERLPSIGRVAGTHLTPTLPMELRHVASEADVIHSHLPTPWSADVSAILGSVYDIPVALTYHNHIVGTGAVDYLARLYNKTLLKVTLSRTDAIIVTHDDYERRSPVFSATSTPVVTIPNGVNTRRFRPVEPDRGTKESLGFDTDRPNIAFLGVLNEHHRYKGLNVLLTAMDHLVETSELPPHLVVGGSGAHLPKYREQVENLGLGEHVSFSGWIPETDLPAFYSSADVFVLPSTSAAQEGFGLVLLEALACETPVVATSIVGIDRDLRNREIGRCVPPKEPRALANAIDDVLSGDVSTMGQAGRVLCEQKYTWERVGSEFESLYQRLVDETR